MAKAGDDGRERLHLLMPPRTKALLDELQARTGAANMTEVVRRALALYDMISRELEKGHELFVRNPHEKSARGGEVKVKLL